MADRRAASRRLPPDAGPITSPGPDSMALFYSRRDPHAGTFAAVRLLLHCTCDMAPRSGQRRMTVASNSPDIETGTEVFGSDGNKIGTVSRIFSAAPPPADTVPMGVVDTPADPHPTDMEPGERSSGQFGAVGGFFRDDDETDGGSGTELGGGAVGWGSTSEIVDLSHSESGTVL